MFIIIHNDNNIFFFNLSSSFGRSRMHIPRLGHVRGYTYLSSALMSASSIVHESAINDDVETSTFPDDYKSINTHQIGAASRRSVVDTEVSDGVHWMGGWWRDDAWGCCWALGPDWRSFADDVIDDQSTDKNRCCINLSADPSLLLTSAIDG